MRQSAVARALVLALVLVLAIIALGQPSGVARAGAYQATGHADRATGVLRDPALPRGACGQCHVDVARPEKLPAGLWRHNDNDLCFACHDNERMEGPYPGRHVYESSAHGMDARTVWPGPYPRARGERGAAGKCLNCHDPHGQKDRGGIISSLLFAREDELCLACHDGDPSARDIAREIRKPYSHLAVRTFGIGKHRAGEPRDQSSYSYVGGSRHCACSDCHNAHAVLGDPVAPAAPMASRRNARVSRVRVTNGAAGTIPLYEYRPANDTSAPVLEYEICFKCHSSWTNQPPGDQDLARLFNANNASFHPVEGQGRNLGIALDAFTPGQRPTMIIYCSDCHGSDDVRRRGPHGSQFPHLLRRPYEARAAQRMPRRDDLCFLCHNFDTYANPTAPTFQQQASRFNPGSSPKGHAFHVGEQSVPCYACHDSHGSPDLPALLVTGRVPGLLSFAPNALGGSCTSQCHGTQSYQANYPR